MKQFLDLLAEHPFFRDLPREYLEFIATCGRNVAFKAGTPIAREGDPAEAFYVIRKGRAAIEMYAPGRGSLRVQTVSEGDVLGWSWLIPPHRWVFDVRALQDVRAIAMDGRCLRGKCDENHEVGYLLMRRFAQLLTRRLEATRIQLLDLYSDKVV